MTVLIVQHKAIEGPYRIGQALVRAGVGLDVRRTYLGDPVPEDAAAYSGLVVMGGPMAAYSDDDFAGRGSEIALLATAVRADVPTLAVCLGAQLLTVAAGGRALPGDGLEVGWAEVQLTPDAADDKLLGGLPVRFTALHWHGDTVELPAGAVLLASSARYANQAWRIGPRAWGLQFHPEVDGAGVEGFVTEFGHEVPEEAGQQIRTQAPQRLAELAPLADTVFGRFAALC